MPNAISLADIRAARERIADSVIHTPLLRLNADDVVSAASVASSDIYLKLENLQPIGSFKLRGAGNAIAQASLAQLSEGVYTASAGNMAQGVAWHARRLGIPCSVIVPDSAPEAKLSAIRRLGGQIIKVPYATWWQIIVTHQYEGMRGLFVHPVSDPAVIAGNGSIGLEILDDMPEVETVLIPYGGGGLCAGIASAIHALKPSVKVIAVEPETAAGFYTSRRAGQPSEAAFTPSFVDGAGSRSALADMWPLTSRVLDDACTVSLGQVAAAIKLLIERNRVVAEGAGALALAAALAGHANGKTVCVVSGGNIDSAKIAKILANEIP